jgi:branched-chain amino acid transport system permease protein
MTHRSSDNGGGPVRDISLIANVARAVVAFLTVAMTGMTGLAFATPAQAQEGPEVRGTLEDRSGEEDVPLEGVEITVTDAETGEEIGTATTGPDGTYQLDLPGAGSYAAELDVDTLPEGLSLRNPDRNPLEFDMGPGQARPLLFPVQTGEGGDAASGGGGAGRIDVQDVLQLLVEGLKFGLIIAIASVGLSLIFGTTGLVNFAHGELVSFGALMAYFFNQTLGIHLIPAAVLAIVAGGLAGGSLDLTLWRPLRGRGTGLLSMLVVSIGLSLFLRYAMLYQFGGRTRPYAQYAVQRAVDIGPVTIAPKDLLAMALSILVLAGVGLMLTHTRIGKALRAVADNRDLAESSGIDVQRVILFVWILGGGLATLGGIFQGLAEQVSWQMGFQLLLLMFAGVILGGIGTAYGALVGSLLVGIIYQMSSLVVPNDLRLVVAFFLLIVVLLFRPQGMLGRRERVG